jgi:hypothetical protein
MVWIECVVAMHPSPGRCANTNIHAVTVPVDWPTRGEDGQLEDPTLFRGGYGLSIAPMEVSVVAA